ncbi:calcium/sodium antiporter [Romboutsia sp.]|uniref:calcium/sodium antiporter n=1 Tax=Romboutsia sp. TaxID=1965302 RepID=UPI003F309E58
MSFIMLFVGFLFLIKGADLFVEGSSSIAKKFNVPAMIIGLTIVAMGTSAPEASVSITSSLIGQNDMSVANIVGSNFFNILIVLGVSSLIATLPVSVGTIKKDTPFLILTSLLMLVFAIDLSITRVEGFLLLSGFTYFIVSTIKNAKKSTEELPHLDMEAAIDSDVIVVKDISMSKTITVSVIGIVGIVFGGDLVVKSASSIASSLGMSTNLIGLTIVAVGTSLPEFVTSVMAVRKGENDIAIGNVIGSNIFNILFILGLASTISPITTMSIVAIIDIIFMIFSTVLLYLFMKKQNSITKVHGIIFIVIYFAYMTYTVIR